MSQTENTIKHNSYFEGNVQSLGLSTEKGPATVGVMKKGTYTFSASSPETMLVISGTLKVRNADGSYNTYKAQEQFEVASGSSFDVLCEEDAAYICYYC
ncbi:pyrimidine/purine nucleoside phosphorylase [Pedobacter sp. GR22-6]|uniref:pyrimidine/purine nucleoside phosphorylase n=1 Tax=Pedobacter sp. GR22-6 TaxID=3127957 RepID=UPI00307DB810